MERQRIMEMWNKFSRTVLPPGCSQIQIVETRRAFFGGAIAMFQSFTGEITEASDENAVKAMDEINAEILFYVERLKSGAM